LKKARLYIFDILFFILICDCIIDPSDTIFKLKFFLLAFSIISGFLTKRLNMSLIFFSLFISIVFPAFFSIIGLINNEFYSVDVLLMQWKPYLIFLLLPFISESCILNYTKSTFLVIPITLIAFYVILNFDIFLLEPFIGDYENTLKLAKRDFGSYEFLMIYHKTVSLLVFGLGFSLYQSKKSLFYTVISFSSIAVLFLSSTRANWIALVLLLSFHFYQRYIVNSNKLKFVFISFILLCFILFLPALVGTFFSKDEASISDRLTFVNDYRSYWINNPFNLFIGQGLGNGFRSGLRGITYNLEFTFLEIIRIYGLIGFFFFLSFFMYPLYIYIKFRIKLKLPDYYIYLFFAYFIFIFIVVPSNPLFFSSTGFLLLLVFYSETFFLKRSYNKI